MASTNRGRQQREAEVAPGLDRAWVIRPGLARPAPWTCSQQRDRIGRPPGRQVRLGEPLVDLKGRRMVVPSSRTLAAASSFQ